MNVLYTNFSVLWKKKDLYLSDDSFVLPDPAVFLLQPYIVKEWQRQRLSITAQNGLALSHISSREGEAATRVSGVMANVTQRCRATQFLSCSSKLPARVEEGKTGRGWGFWGRNEKFVTHSEDEACRIYCKPLHDKEGVGHIVLFALCLVNFFRQHIIHCALQEVGHFHIPVSIKHTIQSFTTPTEAVYRKGSNTESERGKNESS